MVFVMPYINMRKIKNVLSLGGDKHQFADSCAICDSWPTNPQQFTDCKHLFCYHCIAVSFLKQQNIDSFNFLLSIDLALLVLCLDV